MSELPLGWVSAGLLEVAQLLRGVTYTKADARDVAFVGSIPVLRAMNIVDRGFDLTDLVHVPAQLVSEAQCVQQGDVVVATSSGSISVVGKGAQAQADMHAGFGAFCGLLRPHRELVQRYFGYYFASQEYRQAVSEMARGVNINNLKREHFGSLVIPIAPPSEQKRIADKLDLLLARVDACGERLNRVPGILTRFRQSVLAAATAGDLTRDWREDRVGGETAAEAIRRTPAPTGKETGRSAGVKARPGRYALSVGQCERKLPAGWEWTPLARVAKLESGHTPSRANPLYWGGGIPWIGIKDARDHHGKVIDITLQTVTDEGLANSAARLLPAQTVCVSRTASVGYVTIMGRPMATSQDFANWICTGALLPEYLMYALMAEGDGLRDFGEGTTHTTIYYPELKALQLALPPISEQTEIARRVRGLLRLADQIESSHRAASARLAALPASSLSKAFRGELVPQDPADEPATELLVRLRTSRSKGPSGDPSKSARPTRRPGGMSRQRRKVR